VDAHHVRHWADGGETSLENLVVLCRYHHGLLHQGSFNISVAGNTAGGEPDALVFTTPSGKVITRSFFPQFPEISAETSRQALSVYAPDVSPLTCVPYWQGENCDYGMAVDGLLSRHPGG
jgi:hypothetical protein